MLSIFVILPRKNTRRQRVAEKWRKTGTVPLL